MRIISISEMKIWAPHSLHEIWDSLYIYILDTCYVSTMYCTYSSVLHFYTFDYIQ